MTVFLNLTLKFFVEHLLQMTIPIMMIQTALVLALTETTWYPYRVRVDIKKIDVECDRTMLTNGATTLMEQQKDDLLKR